MTNEEEKAGESKVAEEEKKFVQSFADEWGIEMDWDYIENNFKNIHGEGFHKLRKAMKEYLATSPPPAQITQLADVIVILINIDNVVAKEEELIQAELLGQIDRCLGKNEINTYNAVVVPRSEEQEKKNKELLSDLKKENFAGGYAYISEAYYSYKYADVVCEKYREADLFAVVVQVHKHLEKENMPN